MAIKARPTTYKGIKMRSRLEADYAQYLDSHSYLTWDYEPECFAGPEGQWLPDFKVSGKSMPVEYVEIKPVSFAEEASTVNAVADLLTRMSVAWRSEPDAFLSLTFWGYQQRAPVWEIKGWPRAHCYSYLRDFASPDLTHLWWVHNVAGRGALYPLSVKITSE